MSFQNKMKSEKKGGIVGDIVSGTAGLIIIVIVALVITSTLLGANLLTGSPQVVSSGATNDEAGWINNTPYILGGGAVNDTRSNYVATAYNSSDGSIIVAANYTLTASTGSIVNATALVWDTEAVFNYTFDTVGPDSIFEKTSDAMGGNLSAGIDNVSSKIPTILLIAAVVLLFGVIVLLVKQSQAMGIGGQGGSL